MLFVCCLRNRSLFQYHKDFLPRFLLEILYFYHVLTVLINLGVWCDYRSRFIFSHMTFSCSNIMYLKHYSSHHRKSIVENQLTIPVWAYLWTPCSAELICMPILMPIPGSLDYYSLIVSFKILLCSSKFFVLAKNCFGYSRSPVFPYTF